MNMVISISILRIMEVPRYIREVPSMSAAENRHPQENFSEVCRTTSISHRSITAMVTIREEIDEIANDKVSLEASVLRNAPHTVADVVSSDWDRAYSVEQAAFPVPELRVDKYFTPVSRIDQAGGDRNLICSCPPPEAFEID